jgi:hypothetical protein
MHGCQLPNIGSAAPRSTKPPLPDVGTLWFVRRQPRSVALATHLELRNSQRMGTVHDFRRKPKNTDQFKGPAPRVQVPSRRAARRQIRHFVSKGLLVGLGWAAIISIAAAAALLG